MSDSLKQRQGSFSSDSSEDKNSTKAVPNQGIGSSEPFSPLSANQCPATALHPTTAVVKSETIGTPSDRKKMCCQCIHFIHKMAALLKFQASTIAMASTLFHRVCIDVSMDEMEPFLTAMASLFLAGKSDDHFRKSRDIVNVAFHVIDPAHPVSIGDGLFRWKEALFEREQQILRLLDFNAHIDPPHKLLFNLCSLLFGQCSSIARLATSILNDSVFSTVWVEFTALELACASLNVASLLLNEITVFEKDRGSDDFSGATRPTSWRDMDVSEPVIGLLSKRLLDLYTTGLPPFDPVAAYQHIQNWKHVQPSEHELKEMDDLRQRYKQKQRRDLEQGAHAIRNPFFVT